jgi:hypothetical protein
MGLDIYLYTRAEQEANNAHTQGWEDAYAKHYDGETGELKPGHTEEGFKRDSDAVPPYQGSADQPSQLYPDHLFKRNYLRSSYNDSGFNRAVPDMLARDADLYTIFEPVIRDNPEPYETILDDGMIAPLEEVRANALAIAAELRESDPLRTMHVSAPILGSKDHQWDHLPTEDEVLAWYREEKATHDEYLAKFAEEGTEPREEHGYMNAKGEVFGFTRGMEVLAVTIGGNSLAGFSAQFPANTVGGQIGMMPQAVLVYRQTDEGKLSYIQSAEIIGEFCDYAIELVKRDGSCVMHWSG